MKRIVTIILLMQSIIVVQVYACCGSAAVAPENLSSVYNHEQNPTQRPQFIHFLQTAADYHLNNVLYVVHNRPAWLGQNAQWCAQIAMAVQTALHQRALMRQQVLPRTSVSMLAVGIPTRTQTSSLASTATPSTPITPISVADIAVAARRSLTPVPRVGGWIKPLEQFRPRHATY